MNNQANNVKTIYEALDLLYKSIQDEDLDIVIHNAANLLKYEMVLVANFAKEHGYPLDQYGGLEIPKSVQLIADVENRVTLTPLTRYETIVKNWTLMANDRAKELINEYYASREASNVPAGTINNKLHSLLIGGVWFYYLLTIATNLGWLSAGASRKHRLENNVPKSLYKRLKECAFDSGYENDWWRSCRGSSIYNQRVVATRYSVRSAYEDRFRVLDEKTGRMEKESAALKTEANALYRALLPIVFRSGSENIWHLTKEDCAIRNSVRRMLSQLMYRMLWMEKDHGWNVMHVQGLLNMINTTWMFDATEGN